MRFSLILLSLFLIVSCSQYEEGIVSMDALEQSGKKHLYNGKPYTGVSISKDSEGWVYIRNFKDGFLHGTGINMRDGFLSHSMTLINNERNGMSISFGRDGNVQSKSNHLNDLPHGIHESFYPDTGNLRSRSYRHEANFDGLYQSFKQNGELDSSTCYKNGVKVQLADCQK